MLNFCLYKPCAMCLTLLHFQPCAVSEPDCNCCLSNKYTYMQLRSPEVTRVNFHLSCTVCIVDLCMFGYPECQLSCVCLVIQSVSCMGLGIQSVSCKCFPNQIKLVEPDLDL